MKLNFDAKIGRFYGLGVGPGDPWLLTLKAQKILSQVSYIFVPRKSEESDSFARSIINSQINNPEQKVIGLVFPMQKVGKGLTIYWEEAAETIWEPLSAGKDCAFINLGDPLLYGTFIYVRNILQTKHPELLIEIVPGVTSVTAAAAALNFPLASNNERLAIISAEKDGAFIRETLKNFDTVVFLKVSSIFEQLLDILDEMKLAERSIYIRRCSTAEEEIIRDIHELKGMKLDYFSLLLVRRNKW